MDNKKVEFKTKVLLDGVVCELSGHFDILDVDETKKIIDNNHNDLMEVSIKPIKLNK